MHPFAVSLSGSTVDNAPGAAPPGQAAVEPACAQSLSQPLATETDSFVSFEMSPFRKSIRSSEAIPATRASWLDQLTPRSRPNPPPSLPPVTQYVPNNTMALSVTSFAGFNIAFVDEAQDPDGRDEMRRRASARLLADLSDIFHSDVLWLGIALLVLSLIERTRLFSDPDPTHHFSLFAIAFELMSAYGTCGVSLGYPGSSNSLTEQFSTPGKLVVMAVMVAGKLRGFPHVVMQGVVLPAVDAFLEPLESEGRAGATAAGEANSEEKHPSDGAAPPTAIVNAVAGRLPLDTPLAGPRAPVVDLAYATGNAGAVAALPVARDP